VSAGEEKLEALENKFNAVMLHTSSEGQSALKSLLTTVRDDFETLKALLSKTSIHLGQIFIIIFVICLYSACWLRDTC